LTYNPLFKLAVDIPDLLPRFVFRELARIPPNHLRIRVGVGNRIFGNQVAFLSEATKFWIHYLHAGICRLDSTIVDIGCGCGRYAHALRDYRYKAETFSGRYVGIDVDQEALDWCTRHFDRERFEFHRSTHVSRAYRAAGSQDRSPYALPVADGSVDFVFSTSLFTHLLEDEVANYLRESWRVLKPGGHMVMNFFSMDHPPPTYGGRHSFRFQVGNAHVESDEIPEAAVAYREEFLVAAARQAGFEAPEARVALGDWQPILVARR
jgi:SAM-dependent methyltransferase